MPIYNLVYGIKESGGGGWQPGANTLAYYTLDNDGTNQSTLTSKFSDVLQNTATYTTDKAHGNNTYSLYCNGSAYAYIPASTLHEFGTSDFTISVWVYSLTNSGGHAGFISNYKEGASTQQIWQGYRLSDRFKGSNKLNFCWNAGSSGDIWVDGPTNISIYDNGWHNVVLSRINGVFNLYLDGNTTPVYTDSNHTTNSIGRNNRICLGFNIADNVYSKVYMNDLIFENRGWTAQDITDYYTLTA